MLLLLLKTDEAVTWKIYFLSALIDHIVPQPEVLVLLRYAGGISSQNTGVMTRIFQINYELRDKPAHKKKTFAKNDVSIQCCIQNELIVWLVI